jgi:hypothetical protein
MSRSRIATGVIAALALSTVFGCAHRSEPTAAAPEKEQAAEPAAKPIPKNHPFAKISEGMLDSDVQKILGQPTNRHEYPTGKAAIPFYHGTDMWRADWSYKGKGHIVFSRNQYTGTYTVIEVLYDPSTP